MVREKESKISEYEKKRLQQIQRNAAKLKELGIRPRVAPAEKKARFQKMKGFEKKRLLLKDSQPAKNPSRYQLRSKGPNVKREDKKENYSSDEADDRAAARSRFPRWSGENIFGSIPGVPVGATWAFRMDASYCGIHRPTVSGIHGNKDAGCYSIALSGGYEDDVDEGEIFTYTGSGGRNLTGTRQKPKNLRTAPQSFDQIFERNNLALKISFEKERPVRVIRGYKLDSPYAPEEGYRYDGLYKVTKVWRERGSSGFMICRFRLERLPNQPSLIKKPEIKDEGEME